MYVCMSRKSEVKMILATLLDDSSVEELKSHQRRQQGNELESLVMQDN